MSDDVSAKGRMSFRFSSTQTKKDVERFAAENGLSLTMAMNQLLALGLRAAGVRFDFPDDVRTVEPVELHFADGSVGLAHIIERSQP